MHPKLNKTTMPRQIDVLLVEEIERLEERIKELESKWEKREGYYKILLDTSIDAEEKDKRIEEFIKKAGV